jgi:hypothetical protein
MSRLTMTITRRHWLALAGGTAAWSVTGGRVLSVQPDGRPALERRIARRIQEYESQGFHRTATDVDNESAVWLADLVAEAGLVPAREAFAVNRVDVTSATVAGAGRTVAGIPLFDAAFTGPAGVGGTLGPLGSGAEIGFVEIAPNQAGAGPLGAARRGSRHRAIVCTTRGGRPGLSPSNADSFLEPFGPPVVQVSSEERPWLEQLATRREPVHVHAQVQRTAAAALNVTAGIAGVDRSLPPLVVMTPRSGWYTCASERGGGIVCWLELMRTLQQPQPPRDILFVASSGHELGHLGINAYIERRADIVRRSAGWMHFGANIGAATDPGNTLQASDDAFEEALARRMTAVGIAITRRTPRGTVPGGEAEAVHRGGGRYVSVIGRSALFHNPGDRGPEAVDPAAIARFVDVFTAVARELAT